MENNMESIGTTIEKLVNDFANSAGFGIDTEMEIITHISEELADKIFLDKGEIRKALRNMFFLGQIYNEDSKKSTRTEKV